MLDGGCGIRACFLLLLQPPLRRGVLCNTLALFPHVCMSWHAVLLLLLLLASLPASTAAPLPPRGRRRLHSSGRLGVARGFQRVHMHAPC